MDTMETTGQPATPDAAVTPEPIMRLASGFMAAKHLFAANELGLFEALADAPAGLDALAARTGLTPRAARISADAMVSLGLLERGADGAYRNSAVAAAFLAGGSPADLRPFLRFWDKLSYPAWDGLAEALAKGPARDLGEQDEATQRIAEAGMEAILAAPAGAFAADPALAGRGRLLDIGGGTGSWSLAALANDPRRTATVFELPTVARIARDNIARAGCSDRISVAEGDALEGPLPTGHDACLIANLIHYNSPDDNRRLLRNARAAVAPGARLFVADFWTDPTHTDPPIAALMAGEFAVHLKHGDVYSAAEGQAWLAEAGWRVVSHHPLAGPVSVLCADAV